MSSLRQNQKVFLDFVFNYNFWRHSLYFLKMVLLIGFVGTLTQSRMRVGRVAIPSKGPMRVQYVFLMTKSQSILYVLYFQLFF